MFKEVVLAKKRVLITGGAGLIGTIAHSRLLERFEISVLDLKEVAGVESHVADLADLEDANARVLEGCGLMGPPSLSD